jgi:hypothetical protein
MLLVLVLMLFLFLLLLPFADPARQQPRLPVQDAPQYRQGRLQQWCAWAQGPLTTLPHRCAALCCVECGGCNSCCVECGGYDPQAPVAQGIKNWLQGMPYCGECLVVFLLA